MLGYKKCGIGIFAVLMVCTTTNAVKPEKNSPGYLTDGHGAMDLLFNHVEGYYRKTEFGEGVFFPAYFRGRFGIILETRPSGVYG